MHDLPDSERDQLVRTLGELVKRVERLERLVESGTVPSKRQKDSGGGSPLEWRIGSQWLNRIGIIAVLFGVGFFLKYAFENKWIGPVGRVSAGLLFGVAIMVWSEWFRARTYAVFSLSLKAVATGVLYLSLWAAFQLYGLVPLGAAFAGMVLVTAVTVGFAFLQHAEVLALVAVIGGFATPLLLSTGANREVELFLYLTVLNCATVLLVVARRWSRIVVANVVGTATLFFAWYAMFYQRSAFDVTVAFATIFFAIFAAAPSIMVGQVSRTLFATAVMNAGFYFIEAYLLLWPSDKAALTGCAVGLAALYAVLARKVRLSWHFLYGGLAVAFAAIAIAVRFNSEWISLGWFLLAAGLMAIGFLQRSSLLRWSGLALLAAAALKVFTYDVWRLERGYRIVSFIALGVLLLVLSFIYQRDWLRNEKLSH